MFPHRLCGKWIVNRCCRSDLNNLCQRVSLNDFIVSLWSLGHHCFKDRPQQSYLWADNSISSMLFLWQKTNEGIVLNIWWKRTKDFIVAKISKGWPHLVFLLLSVQYAYNLSLLLLVEVWLGFKRVQDWELHENNSTGTRPWRHINNINNLLVLCCMSP